MRARQTSQDLLRREQQTKRTFTRLIAYKLLKALPTNQEEELLDEDYVNGFLNPEDGQKMDKLFNNSNACMEKL